MTTISKPAETAAILDSSHNPHYCDHDPDVSISGSTSSNSSDQYYTFLNPEVKRSLHVIDADFGVFESKKKPKKVFNLKAPNLNFMKREKESYYNSDYKDNIPATLLGLGDGSGDYDNLRAEPELVDTYMNRPRRSIVRPTNPARIPYRVVEDSDNEMNDSITSDVDSNVDYSEVPSIYDYQPEKQQLFTPPLIPQLDSQQTKHIVKSTKSSPTKNSIVKTLTKIAKSSTTPTPQNTLMNQKQANLNLIKNHKSRIEHEYEIAQLKAEKYRAERDKMRVKLQNHKMAQKLRDYEFYCVNGIDHDAIESDSRVVFGNQLRKNQELLERRRQHEEQQRILQEMQLHLEQQQRQEQEKEQEEQMELERQSRASSSRRRRKRISMRGLLTPPSSMKTPPQLISQVSFRTTQNNRSTAKSDIQLPSTNTSSLFEKLSSNLPPEAREFIDHYANYIPTVGTISDFHDEVLVYIRTTPLISLVYPFYLLLKHLIPKTAKNQRSLRALFVGICDIFMLVVIGCSMWYFIKYVFMIVSLMFKISHYLRII